jgi:hypothetical protein
MPFEPPFEAQQSAAKPVIHDSKHYQQGGKAFSDVRAAGKGGLPPEFGGAAFMMVRALSMPVAVGHRSAPRAMAARLRSIRRRSVLKPPLLTAKAIRHTEPVLMHQEITRSPDGQQMATRGR